MDTDRTHTDFEGEPCNTSAPPTSVIVASVPRGTIVKGDGREWGMEDLSIMPQESRYSVKATIVNDREQRSRKSREEFFWYSIFVLLCVLVVGLFGLNGYVVARVMTEEACYNETVVYLYLAFASAIFGIALATSSIFILQRLSRKYAACGRLCPYFL